MAAEYDFQRKPNPKGDGELQPLYPRIVNRGTITTKRLVSDISHASSFTPGDIEGLLAAFEDRISYYLSEGHHVQLGNMGYFSAGLVSRPVEDKKEIHAQSIFFGKVHFRVSPGFRKQCLLSRQIFLIFPFFAKRIHLSTIWAFQFFRRIIISAFFTYHLRTRPRFYSVRWENARSCIIRSRLL